MPTMPPSEFMMTSVVSQLPRPVNNCNSSNIIELVERWAWYGFFLLLPNYLTGSKELGCLEFTQAQKGTLMGVGTGILYFLPILTGALADRWGYKKVFFTAFVVYVSAFLIMPMCTTYPSFFAAYLLLALGAALFKPIPSATIAKTTNDTPLLDSVSST